MRESALRWFSTTNKVFVEGLPQTWGPAEVATKFNGENLTEISIIKSKEGEATGKAIFTYASEQAAFSAVKYNTSEEFHFRSYLDKKEKTEQTFGERMQKRFVIFNLPMSAIKDDLHTFLTNFGEVDEIDLPQMSNGSPKGYATVIMSDPSTVEAAMNALDGKIFEGVEIKASRSSSGATPSMMANHRQSLINYTETVKRTAHSILSSSHLKLQDTSECILESLEENFISKSNNAEMTAEAHKILSPSDSKLIDQVNEFVDEVEKKEQDSIDYLESIKDSHPLLYKQGMEVKAILDRNDVPLTDRYVHSNFKPVPIACPRPTVGAFDYL